MAGLEFEIDASEAIKKLGLWQTKIVAAVSAALYQEGLAVMAESKRIVPVDTGVLRASGHVERPTATRDGITVKLGYGGAASAYAERQHEDLTYKHKDGQQAKYLEIPLLARQPDIAKNVADKVKGVIK